MAITKNAGRQEVIAASMVFTFAHLAEDVFLEAIDLPDNANILSLNLVITQAWDSVTSDVITVNVGANTFLNAVNAQALACYEASTTLSGLVYTNVDSVDIKWHGVGTAPTHGAARLNVTYIVDGRTAFSQG
jgi:hypothetical protein